MDATGSRPAAPAHDPLASEPPIGEAPQQGSIDAAGARGRFDEVSAPIREALDEPIAKVGDLTRRTMELFPVRVWRHFLARNGFLLTAGMSYQSLFAVFAAVYVVFAVAGIWFFNAQQALEALVLLINTLAPGLVGDNGVITTDTLQEVSTTSTSLFGWTGAVALAGLIWTAIGWVTYTRMAVRSTFGLPKDDRAYLLLKARDFLAALAFGAAILVAAVLSIVATGFLDWFFSLWGVNVSGESPWVTSTIQWGALVVVFIIDTLALAVLFRFLSGAAVPWYRMWRGSLLGSFALSVLQLLGGTVLSFASGNPLLATFTVFIGLLLWVRISSIITLVAAAWIAIEAADANESLRKVTPEQLEAERRAREHEALVTAARVKVRHANQELARARWFERMGARRQLGRAERELAELEASAPPPPPARPTHPKPTHPKATQTGTSAGGGASGTGSAKSGANGNGKGTANGDGKASANGKGNGAGQPKGNAAGRSTGG